MHLSVYTYTAVSTHAHPCLHMYISVYAYASVSTRAHPCLRMYLNVYVYISVYARIQCLRMYVCTSVFARAYPCLRLYLSIHQLTPSRLKGAAWCYMKPTTLEPKRNVTLRITPRGAFNTPSYLFFFPRHYVWDHRVGRAIRDERLVGNSCDGVRSISFSGGAVQVEPS
jgi:hypothetical protein